MGLSSGESLDERRDENRYQWTRCDSWEEASVSRSSGVPEKLKRVSACDVGLPLSVLEFGWLP